MQTALAGASTFTATAATRQRCNRNTCAFSRLHDPRLAGKAGAASFLSGAPLAIRAPRCAAKMQAAADRGRASMMPVEANLLSRFGRVVRAYTFFYSDSAVRELEDPLKMLDQAVLDMQADMVKMRQAAAQVMGAQAQMEQRYRAAQTAADDWKRRAEWALRRGDEDLAREALKRRKTYETTAATLRTQLEQHSKATSTLRANIQTLEGKVTAALSKKETLKARAMSAQATKMLNDEINSLVGGLRSSSNSSVAAFARMEAKVEALEAEAEAAGQLGFPGDALEARFALMEGGSAGSGVDEDLLKLKTDMLASGALPEGRSGNGAAPPRAYESMPNFQRTTKVDIAWP